MKRKWTLFLVIIISFMTIFIGCEKSKSTKEEVYKNFQNDISKMKYYKCKADIEVIGNKKSHKYSFLHEYNGSGNFKLVALEPDHLKGKTIEYKKDKIIVTNPEIEDKLILPNVGKDSQHLFIGDFVENYLQGEDVEIDMKGRYLKLTVCIPGNTKYFNKQILYIDSKDNYPAKLEILDQEGNTRFIVNYSDFKYKK
ncbi:germination lipoprotein GerS [Paraclostridium ghonii]|uniref:Outer membrane lipoprotein-sorting protein n=1 Tax=Paraclostridium ghonii TaxID=29358 RepID=A0ABU0N4V4_9FIRM|nr:germination lipoprotein GerS [Paeniclostridium ghonii]MDQ0557843.1 outer membrane lipoprotein-sorting protein [Paeniclostridium ghonii]